MKGEKMPKLVGVDLKTLTEKIKEAEILLLFINNKYIEGLKDPQDIEHHALNIQIREAAKGKKEVYMICYRPIEYKNFRLLMDMLEGGNIKVIVFLEPNDKEDEEKAAMLIGYLMGPARVSGSSRDAWVLKE